jgi:hypothetical protein
MSLLTEKILILYEIAMSISEGPDLASMAKRTLLTILRKFNCPAGAIFSLHKEATRLHFRDLVVIPRNVHNNSTYSAALAHISTIDPDSIAKGSLAGLPFHEINEDNMHYYIMSLPSFGLILLLKSGKALPPDLIKDIQPLNQKLAEACNAWLSKQQLKENEIKLKKYSELLNQNLSERIVEIKTLKGLLPICSNCKKIRDDQGYWNQIEKYIGERSNAQFSHSICPECAKKLYPNVDLYNDDGKVIE